MCVFLDSILDIIYCKSNLLINYGFWFICTAHIHYSSSSFHVCVWNLSVVFRKWREELTLIFQHLALATLDGQQFKFSFFKCTFSIDKFIFSLFIEYHSIFASPRREKNSYALIIFKIVQLQLTLQIDWKKILKLRHINTKIIFFLYFNEERIQFWNIKWKRNNNLLKNQH